MHEKVHHIFVAARYIVCVCVSVCMRAHAQRETKKTDVRDNCLPVLVVTLPLFSLLSLLFHSHFLPPFPSCTISLGSVSFQAGFGFTMACWD